MILDRLSNFRRYLTQHPGFQAGFDYLRSTDFSQVESGKHSIDGERLLAIVAHDPGRGHQGAKLESHRRYIDIQYVIEGQEEIGWKPISECSRVDVPFIAEKDIGFFADEPEIWLPMPPGTFVIFYPEDAHAPLAGPGPTYKAVMKVAVDW
jgi:biofilm protein TabA